jgi:hypothetical protein
MRKVFAIALVVLGAAAAPAGALELKNVRSIYGPFGGVRAGNKLLPGDIIFLSFEMEDLKMDPDSGLVNYTNRLEVIDDKGKVIFARDNKDNKRYLALGQARLPDRAQVVTGTEQAAGKYTVKLTVTDNNAANPKGPKESKSFVYKFEILEKDFGLIHAVSPSVGVVNQDFQAQCALVGFGRDAKKMPNVSVRLIIRDEKGNPTLPKAFISNIPKDLPDDVDVKKLDLVPLPFPIFLNRPGRFTLEVTATDHLSKKTVSVSFPLLVLDTSVVGGQ